MSSRSDVDVRGKSTARLTLGDNAAVRGVSARADRFKKLKSSPRPKSCCTPLENRIYAMNWDS